MPFTTDVVNLVIKHSDGPVSKSEEDDELPSSVVYTVATMPTVSTSAPVTVAKTRKSSILEYLGLWQPNSGFDGGDVGVFPA